MYSSITIIYNPKSTGPSEKRANRLAERLQRSKKLCNVPIDLISTDYQGHAEQIAYDATRQNRRPLIISVSGDGGYHEVVNGALRAQDTQHEPICAVLPAGNANDHRRAMRRRPLYQSIVKKKPVKIDILKIAYTHAGERHSRYAHSYIGLGLSPEVALKLNSEDLSWMRQNIIVVEKFFSFRPFEITHDGETMRLDSLIFGNIREMAKYVKLDMNSSVDDGSFEVVSLEHSGKLRLLGTMIRAATIGLRKNEKRSHYSFSSTQPLTAQLDGEIAYLPAGTPIHVTCEAKKLETVF
jgi:diacylglycerol kinase (ATP)